MKIEKEYEIKASADKVWQFVSDIDKFGSCIPYVENYDKKNAKHFVIVVKPTFAFLKGNITMDWKIVEVKKNYGKLNINAKMIGGGYNSSSILKAKKKGKITVLSWQIEVKLNGLLKAVPESLVQGTATIIADKIFENLKSKVE